MINPKSLENLQPFDQMDTEKHKELSRRGGLASAKVRRHNRERREMMTALIKYGDFFKTFMEIADMTPAQLKRELRKIERK